MRMEPPKKTTFLLEFDNYYLNHNIYTYTTHNQMPAEKMKKKMYGLKMVAKNEFSLRKKKKKNTLPKKFLNEIWLKLRECEYNYITGIKF